MENSNKLLTVLSILVLIALIVEAGYIIYITYHKRSPPTGSENMTQEIPERRGIPAIDEEIIADLRLANKDFLTKSILKNTYEGMIVELEYENEFKIRIKGQNGATNGYVFFSEDAVNLIQVSRRMVSNVEESISTKDLKIGDRIKFEISANLLRDLTNYLTEVKIIVINP